MESRGQDDQEKVRSGSDVHYYHFDALGSTRLLTDDTGTITDTYAYDAWGNVISHDQYVGSTDQQYQIACLE